MMNHHSPSWIILFLTITNNELSRQRQPKCAARVADSWHRWTTSDRERVLLKTKPQVLPPSVARTATATQTAAVPASSAARTDADGRVNFLRTHTTVGLIFLRWTNKNEWLSARIFCATLSTVLATDASEICWRCERYSVMKFRGELLKLAVKVTYCS